MLPPTLSGHYLNNCTLVYISLVWYIYYFEINAKEVKYVPNERRKNLKETELKKGRKLVWINPIS